MILGSDLPVDTNAFARGVIAVTHQVTADKSPLFETHFMVAYGLIPQTYFNTVDPDDIEPYLEAWVRYAVAHSVASYDAQTAYNAMVANGLDQDRAVEVANAVTRAVSSGLLTEPAILNPNGNQAKPGIVDRTVTAVESLATGAQKAITNTGTVIEWAPFLAVGLGVLAVGFVAWPYLSAARAPARRLRS